MGSSIYILGLEDRTCLSRAYGKEIGSASVNGSCIKFKALKDIQLAALETALRDGIAQTSGLARGSARLKSWSK